MQAFIVIGVSSGIGLALVQELLSRGKVVLGLGRKNVVTHPNYTFTQLDLSDANAVASFAFPEMNESFALIYNAGVLGEVKPVVNQSLENSAEVFQVNYLSAVTLSQKVLQDANCCQLVYISSGAAKRAIAGWSQYCASKAALDRFAETLQIELIHAKRDCIVKSIAPGVVDTPMQKQIRLSDESDFPQVLQFINLYENQELSSVEEVAQKLYFVSQNCDAFPDVCLSLRDVELPKA
jgi:benzil reductase ((S)-benzoin forming)